MSYHSQSDGFTLIEVILASMILGLGLTVLLTGASRCLATIKMAKTYQGAEYTLYRGELEHQVDSTMDMDEFNVSEEEYPDGFVYSRDIEEDEDEDGLRKVTVRVVWKERGIEKKEEVTRYILDEKGMK